jgi:hypothetical protein
MAILKNTIINDTGFLQLPVGTTVQRPNTPTTGSIRVNSTTGRTEYYNANTTTWENTRIPRGVTATGGNRVYDVEKNGIDYRVHIFTQETSTFSVTQGGEVEYLIVAGGGGGGSSPTNNNDGCGGGGAGGLLTGILTVTPQSYTITVGLGGLGINSALTNGTNGNNSSAFGFTAIGGGGGATQNTAGLAGGSGGGAGNGGGAGPYAGGSGVAGQGNAGGLISTAAENWVGSGGGGAGAAGRSGNQGTVNQGFGGSGISSNISGTSTFYAGGGGGGASGGRLGGGGGNSGVAPLGGLGGGASGGYVRGKAPNGGPNTGGGGGGGLGNDNAWGGDGGSGIVIVSYKIFKEQSTLVSASSVVNGLVLDIDASNPVSYPGSGTLVRDTRALPITGTLVNGIGIENPGSSAAAFNFFGTSVYIDISITPFNLYNLNVWLYNNYTIPGNDAAIGGILSSYQSPINFNRQTTQGINLGGWTGSATNESVHIWSNSSTASGFNGMTHTRGAVAIGWHNFQFNWNGATYDIWIDGVKQSTFAANFGHATLQPINAVRIGGDVAQSYYFIGRIPAVKMYNRQLSDAEVLQNFEETRWKYGI